MREVTAYFVVEQIQDALPGVGKEAANQYRRRDFDALSLILPVIVAALPNHTFPVLVVGQFHIH